MASPWAPLSALPPLPGLLWGTSTTLGGGECPSGLGLDPRIRTEELGRPRSQLSLTWPVVPITKTERGEGFPLVGVGSGPWTLPSMSSSGLSPCRPRGPSQARSPAGRRLRPYLCPCGPWSPSGNGPSLCGSQHGLQVSKAGSGMDRAWELSNNWTLKPTSCPLTSPRKPWSHLLTGPTTANIQGGSQEPQHRLCSGKV